MEYTKSFLKNETTIFLQCAITRVINSFVHLFLWSAFLFFFFCVITFRLCLFIHLLLGMWHSIFWQGRYLKFIPPWELYILGFCNPIIAHGFEAKFLFVGIQGLNTCGLCLFLNSNDQCLDFLPIKSLS